MKKLFNGLLAVAVLLISACSPTQRNAGEMEPESPNVIMILVDDMGYGDLSFYGLSYKCRRRHAFTACQYYIRKENQIYI